MELTGTQSHNTAVKSRARIIASNIAHNLWLRLNRRSAARDWSGGSTHLGLPLAKSISYIQRVYDDYLNYGELQPSDFAGKRILEIGPGDNFGVALRLLAAGAEQVVCLDKFYAKRNQEQQLQIYRALREQLSAEQRSLYDEAVSLGEHNFTVNEKRMRYIHGVGIESAGSVLEPGSFDFIISRAVIYEIHKTDEAFASMDQLLRPGGKMVHNIACLDWMFPQNRHHPLEYLTVAEPLYRWMTGDSGKSNRRMIDYYRKKMRELGYQANFHIIQALGSTTYFPPNTSRLEENVHYSCETLTSVREIRPRLRPQFRSLSDEDLMIRDTFLVAIKPGAIKPVATKPVATKPINQCEE